ncbi:MAG: cytochrome P450 [Pseudomonadota bacterium]
MNERRAARRPPTLSREESALFTDPVAYSDVDGWHASAAKLRRRGGLCKVDSEAFRPFLAAVGHREITEIESNSKLFRNAPFPILVEGMERGGGAPPTKNLVGMDGEEHRVYRSIIADWFAPKAINDRAQEIHDLARQYVDRLLSLKGDIDFVKAVGAGLPLRFIMATLGLPEEDDEKIHRWTTEFFGAQDPDLAGSTGDMKARMDRIVTELSAYFIDKSERWRSTPDDSLGSVIANARIDGEFLAADMLCAYFILLSAAGHDTVATVLTGGIEALARHPTELSKLKSDTSLVANAVEEIIRWVTPTKHFMRTAVADTVVNGYAVEAGDWVLLSYPSANRDEHVFENPFRFDVSRKEARKHLAFGTGPHFCIGNRLARLQLRIFFEELIGRVDAIELCGDVEYSATTFVSTFKRLPIRVTKRRSAGRAR